MHLERDYEIDFLRVAAALAIILLHVTAHVIYQGTPTRLVWWLNGMTQWGVPAFLACSGYLFGLWLGKSEKPMPWLKRRARRLLIPYAFWSLVYMAMLLTVTVVKGTPAPQWDILAVIFTGGAYSPMWFLPALFYSSLVGLLSLTKLGLTRLWILVGLLTVASSGLTALGFTFGGYFASLPLIVLTYLSGAMVAARGLQVPSVSAKVGIAFAAVLLTGIGLTYGGAGQEQSLAATVRTVTWYVTGPVLLCCVLSLRAPSLRFVGRLTPYLIGVYLVHSVWLEVYAWLVPNMSLPPLVWIAVIYPLVVATTIVTVILGARIRVLRHVLV